jgi:hypothetical protein
MTNSIKKSHRKSSDSSSSSSSSSLLSKECDFDELYKTLKSKLINDPNLMIAGSDAFGVFTSTSTQIIPLSGPFHFENNGTLLNVDHVPGTSQIYVRKSGLYNILFTIAPAEAAQITITVNNMVMYDKVFGTLNAAGQLTGTVLIPLKEDDCIVVRNLTSVNGAITVPVLIGGLPSSINLEIALAKIAPYPEHNKLIHRKEKDLSHKTKKLFYRLEKELRKDSSLMMCGSDAYGSFYRTTEQTIELEAPVLFTDHYSLLNMMHVNNSGDITIKKAGVYSLIYLVSTTQAAQFTFFINGNPINSTTSGINKGANSMHLINILELNENDVVSVRNHTSAVGAVTISAGAGGTAGGINAGLVIRRIAPQLSKIKTSKYSTHENNFDECVYNEFVEYLANCKHMQCFGNDAYFAIYSSVDQIINIDEPVIFSVNGPHKNIRHKQGTSEVNIFKDGIYYFFFDVEANAPSQFTIFVNNVPIANTTDGTDSGSGQSSIRQLMTLYKGDVVKVVNYKSFLNPVKMLVNPGGTEISPTARFTAYKVAPIINNNDKSKSEKIVKRK